MNYITYRNAVLSLGKEIVDNINVITKTYTNKYSITNCQFHILTVIASLDNCTVSDLARLTNMDNGNTSALSKKLEKEGFIIRTRNSKDERVVNLSLTAKAKKLIDTINKDFDEKYKMIIEKGDNYLDEFLRLLEDAKTITNKLKNIQENND